MTKDPESSSNPYLAPGAQDDGVHFVEVSETDRISARTVEALAGTQTWVRLIGWLATLFGCFIGLTSIAQVLRIEGDDWEIVVRILWTGLLGVFYATAGVLLLRYAGRIGDFVISRRVDHLDDALEAQRTLWRFLGASIALLFILLLGSMLLLFWGAGAEMIWRVFG
jgi:hypothetical protein